MFFYVLYVLYCFSFFFFFKQNTAYEMRISDWSSDVCSSDLFATNTRFPHADEVVVDWPHRYLAAEQEAGRIDPRTVLCVLTHDPKFDVPLLEVALRIDDVAYIGAMGSRRTHDGRLDRLREAGLPAAEQIGTASSRERVSHYV